MEATSGNKAPRKAAMAFILITLFIDILGIGIVIPVIPELVKELVGGESPDAGRYVGVIGAAYSLTLFLCAPLMGALSDRFGRRPVLLCALFGLGVDFLIQGFAPNIGWLFIGRILAGMMGASFTTAHAYIADVSTPENRAGNFGLAGVMFGLGFIFGPAIGGVLGDTHLRLPFFVSAGLAMVNWLYGYFILPESLPLEKRGPFSLAKANPISALKQLGIYPLIAGLSIAFAFTSLAQRGLENVWVLYTGHRFGWDPRMNGITLALVGLTAAIVQGGLVRPVIRHFGERRTVIFGLTIQTFAFLFYGLSYMPWMIFATIVFGSLGGITGPAIQSIVAGSVDSSDQGKIQGALTSLMSLTSIFAPLLFTAGLFSYFTSENAPFQLPGAPFLFGSLMQAIALVVAVRVLSRPDGKHRAKN